MANEYELLISYKADTEEAAERTAVSILRAMSLLGIAHVTVGPALIEDDR